MRRILTRPQLIVLHKAIIQGFPGSAGHQQFELTCTEADIDFAEYNTEQGLFATTVWLMLETENSKTGLDLLQAKLFQSGRLQVVAAIEAIRATTPVSQGVEWEKLIQNGLLIDGDPFLNHDTLRDQILPDLVDDTKPLRTVVITGPNDSGKTFGLRLIRRHCRTSQFRIVEIDPAATIERDCKALARTVARALRLKGFQLPEMDTSEPRIARRLVDELTFARGETQPVSPIMLVFDHLNRDISAPVIDFVEEIAVAIADGRLGDMRALLIGFPRPPANNFAQDRMLTNLLTQPGPEQLAEYIDRVLEAVGRDVDDVTFDGLIRAVFDGEQLPYSHDFMVLLPSKVRGILNRILRAPAK